MPYSSDMPSVMETGSSWADEVDAHEGGAVGSLSVELDEKTGVKTVTEYKINEEGKKVKITRKYKIEHRKVSKSIARRKLWKKYGLSEHDPEGPNPSDTIICEDVFMQFVHNKEAQLQDTTEEDPLTKLKGQKMVSCRICKGDHWTTKCPYKDTLAPMEEGEGATPGAAVEGAEGAAGAAPAAPAGGAAGAGAKPGKYVPPSLRGGAGARPGAGAGLGKRTERDESATIRVTNLPEETRESDLQDLFKHFGAISRIYLAKDKITGSSKGFAFINFFKREDAANAIRGVSGFGYNHLILNVEWAKPSANN